MSKRPRRDEVLEPGCDHPAGQEEEERLAESFRGLPTMTNCLAAWLELAAAPGARPDGGDCARAEEVMMARLQINLQKSFDPELADRAFGQAGGAAPSSSGPPGWLLGVIRSEQCRKLLAALASQHPECRLLSFATAAGDATVAASSSASAAAGSLESEELAVFLRRFGDCVLAVLDAVAETQRPPTAGDDAAHAALRKLCELCCATDFAFVYGLYLLRSVDASGSAQRSGAPTAARRLAQHVYSWASTGGLSPSVRGGATNHPDSAAAAGRQLLLCGRGLLHAREHGLSDSLASMEASGMPSVGEAERLHANLAPKRQRDDPKGLGGDNDDDNGNGLRGMQTLDLLRSRAFFLAMLSALFNSGKHKERAQADLFIEVIAVAAMSAQATNQDDASHDDGKASISGALRSAADACQAVQRVATGWSVNKVCATAMTKTDTSATGHPAWINVPVVAAGLLIWARTHQEATIPSIDRENVVDLQAFVHLARNIGVQHPVLVHESLDVLCNIFKLREKVVESLDAVGRASVKDATGIDIKRNCIEVILELLLLGGDTTMPCLAAVHRFAVEKQIDQSLLRHFVSQVAAVIALADSCSRAFMHGYLDLLRCPQTIAALRIRGEGEHAQSERATIDRFLNGAGTSLDLLVISLT